MEKLILRGIMWGADKVPEHWFEKIPGGFYQEKDKGKNDENGKQKKRSNSSRQRRRRYSDDEYGDDNDHHRRSRRHDRNDGDYRSDASHRRRSSPTRKSYDGSDDPNYDSINDRPRRRRSTTDYYSRHPDSRPPPEHARRSEDPRVDEDYSYHEGLVARPPAGAAGAAGAAGVALGSDSYASPPYSPTSFKGMPSQPPLQSNRPVWVNPPNSTLRGSVSSPRYVPYSNIYGGDPSVPHQSSHQPAPPLIPEHEHDGSSYMHRGPLPPVAKQPGHYQQNPVAQEAPVGNQPGYMPDPYHRAGDLDEQYDGLHDERYEGDEESDTERTASPPSFRRSRPDDPYYKQRDERRARSERRGHDGHDKSQSSRRGKSGIRDAFDTSQRGLGYSAVGALAGGMVGSEFGSSRNPRGKTVPTAVGAAIGALGANVFQAREKKKEQARHSMYVMEDDAYARRHGKGYYSD